MAISEVMRAWPNFSLYGFDSCLYFWRAMSLLTCPLHLCWKSAYIISIAVWDGDSCHSYVPAILQPIDDGYRYLNGLLATSLPPLVLHSNYQWLPFLHTTSPLNLACILLKNTLFEVVRWWKLMQLASIHQVSQQQMSNCTQYYSTAWQFWAVE